MDRTRDAVRKMATALEHSVGDMMGSASTYGSALDGHKSAIERGLSPHTDQDFGSVLLNELAVMQEANDAYKKQLDAANVQIAQQKERLQTLQEEAYVDFLTKIPNRRALLKRFEEEAYRTKRYGHPLSMAFLDIDYFKNINDTHGHQVGDHILRDLVMKMQSSIRKSDYLARYGGEEFAILLPVTSSKIAAAVAEKLRSQLEHSKFRTEDITLQLTVSIGVGQYLPDREEIEQFIARADAAMYEAKANGRNRVESAATASA